MIRGIVNIENQMDYLERTDYGAGYYASDPQLSFNLKANKMRQADLEVKLKIELIEKQRQQELRKL